jgi:hypothetical protein
MKVYFLAFAVILLMGCRSFKPGRYYHPGEPTNAMAVTNSIFYKDGTYKTFFLAEWDTRLVEKGFWKERNNSVVVTIDSSFHLDLKKKESTRIIYRKKIFNNKELFHRIKLLGKWFNGDLKYAPEQTPIVEHSISDK